MNNIEIIYQDLHSFIERSSDAKILTKITDITEFVQKSFANLDHAQKAKGFEKADTEIDPTLKPLSMHVQKVFELVSKFNMYPPKTTAAGGSGNDKGE